MAGHDENEVRKHMIRFLKTHYAKTLGKDIELLDSPEGLEIIHKNHLEGKYDKPRDEKK